MISDEESKELRNLFAKYFKLINGYIKSIGEQKDHQLKEDGLEYESNKNNPSLDDLHNNDLLTQ